MASIKATLSIVSGIDVSSRPAGIRCGSIFAQVAFDSAAGATEFDAAMATVFPSSRPHIDFAFESANMTLWAIPNAPAECTAPQVAYLGDGYCDGRDEGYNTVSCNWDGGDCCAQSCVSGMYVVLMSARVIAAACSCHEFLSNCFSCPSIWLQVHVWRIWILVRRPAASL